MWTFSLFPVQLIFTYPFTGEQLQRRGLEGPNPRILYFFAYYIPFPQKSVLQNRMHFLTEEAKFLCLNRNRSMKMLGCKQTGGMESSVSSFAAAVILLVERKVGSHVATWSLFENVSFKL